VSEWVAQQARNLSVELTEQASEVKFLIRDRDTKFTASFDAVFAADGIGIVQNPVRAPRANAICGRAIGTIRRECHDRTHILGRRHPEAGLAEYVEHYNSHRPTAPSATRRLGPIYDSCACRRRRRRRVRRTDRLGGLIDECRMTA
jgi:putative transposase